jgi:alkanesulfonate monooxygenase SsuD/methylene tetrahydromethanopterin reductase-like flavin-dependent oxidoreductase (luciferase family)
MKVGITLFAQNYTDWDRYQSGAFDRKPMIHDSQAYEEEMQLGDLCEPLGFDSLWTVEHHFTPYTMVPDPLQMLTYFAGRTQKIDFGTMVIVLPWHDPVQTAEKIAMLDNMLRGRKLTLGFGRGAGRVEFESLRIPMGESRERFLEALAVVRAALTNERFSFEGKHYQVPETSVRPQPRSADLTDRMYCAWGTPSSMPMAANSGLGALFIPQKSWAEYAEDMKGFNEVRSQNGWGPRWSTWATIRTAPAATTNSMTRSTSRRRRGTSTTPRCRKPRCRSTGTWRARASRCRRCGARRRCAWRS